MPSSATAAARPPTIHAPATTSAMVASSPPGSAGRSGADVCVWSVILVASHHEARVSACVQPTEAQQVGPFQGRTTSSTPIGVGTTRFAVGSYRPRTRGHRQRCARRARSGPAAGAGGCGRRDPAVARPDRPLRQAPGRLVGSSRDCGEGGRGLTEGMAGWRRGTKRRVALRSITADPVPAYESRAAYSNWHATMRC